MRVATPVFGSGLGADDEETPCSMQREQALEVHKICTRSRNAMEAVPYRKLSYYPSLLVAHGSEDQLGAPVT